MWEYILRDNKARVLMYHSHALPNAFFNVSQEQFIWQLNFLQRHEYRFVTISQLVAKIKCKESLRKVVAITHDDGHQDYLAVVLLELQKREIPATLYWPKYIVTNTLITSDGVVCPLLTREEITEIAKSPFIEIGSHGMTHRELSTLTESELQKELARDDEFSIAYPRGKYNQTVIDAVKKAGYQAGLTTREGAIGSEVSLFEIPRITVDSTMNILAFRGKMTRLYDFYKQIF